MDKQHKLEKLKKVLIKASSLEKGKEIAIAKEFVDLEEKVDNISDKTISQIKKKAEEIKNEIDLDIENKRDTFKKEQLFLAKGEKGDNYSITERDRQEIASSIKVPIVEQIIEKVEVIE